MLFIVVVWSSWQICGKWSLCSKFGVRDANRNIRVKIMICKKRRSFSINRLQPMHFDDTQHTDGWLLASIFQAKIIKLHFKQQQKTHAFRNFKSLERQRLFKRIEKNEAERKKKKFSDKSFYVHQLNEGAKRRNQTI